MIHDLLYKKAVQGTRLHPQKESCHFCRSGCGCPPQWPSTCRPSFLSATSDGYGFRKELGWWVSLKPGLSLSRVFKIMFRGLYWYIYIYKHRNIDKPFSWAGAPPFWDFPNAEPPGSNEGRVRRRDNIFGVDHRISPGFNSWTGGCNWDTMVFIYIYITIYIYYYIYILLYIYITIYIYILLYIYYYIYIWERENMYAYIYIYNNYMIITKV